MITLVVGKPGAGKTSLLTYFAIKAMTVEAYRAVNQTNAFIAQLNAGGFDFDYAQNHLVYSNYDIISHMKGYIPRRSYDMEGYEFGLPDPDHKIKLVYRYSTLIFCEGQSFLNSRKSRNFRSSVSRAYEQHRHWDLNIYIDAQRSSLIDLNVRELSRVILVNSFETKTDKLGRVLKCVWYTIEFEDINDYDRYYTSKVLGNALKCKYVYNGNIFNCYNSKTNDKLFLEDAINNPFYNYEYEDLPYTLDGVSSFCKDKSLNNLKDGYYE